MTDDETRRLSDRERVDLLLDELSRLQRRNALLEQQVGVLTLASFAMMRDGNPALTD